MILKSIPRGIIYHSVWQDFIWLLKALFIRLDDKSKVDEFEKEFAKSLDVKHCVAFPFARTAIYSVLKSLNLPHGSEILMPPITIKAILDVVLDLGLKPVFVDISSETFCFDPDDLNKKITGSTRVALITYLFGIVPDIKAMVAQLKSSDVFIIEDFSQCLYGTFEGKYVGSFGDVGIYSASSIKTLDTYGGGLLVCESDELNNCFKLAQSELSPPLRLQLVRKIITDLVRNMATTRLLFHIAVLPLLRLINFYRPNSILKHIGDRNKDMIEELPWDWFSSYTSFQAEVGMRLIKKVKEENAIRIANVKKIISSVPSASFPVEMAGATNTYWQLVAYFEKPYVVQKYLLAEKIDTSTTSLALISSLENYSYQEKTPNAIKLYNNGLFIPSYPGLNDKDIMRICDVLNKYTLVEPQEG